MTFSRTMLGSGSTPVVDERTSSSVVLVHTEPETDLMHHLALGEGERFAHEAAQPLAQREIPPLHVVGLSAVFAHRFMLLLGHDVTIRLPEVGAAERGSRSPQIAASYQTTPTRATS
jgi:hypothetical protein